MDQRALGAAQQRPRAPQRAVSGGAYGFSQLPKRPTLPSRLSTVRSASQPANIVNITSNGVKSERSNEAAFLGNKAQVVQSPEIIKIEDDEEPPAKRAKTSGEGFRPTGDQMDEVEADRTNETMPGSPLPSLPKLKSTAKRAAGTRRHRFGIDPAARKAHGIEPPAVATRVPTPKKVLDFSPWQGNHKEDDMNETVIKAGHFDKPQAANQNESNSAKATIWQNLSSKNHHGLSMLGYLFTAVVERRQAIGRCTAPSTFKPPPRVTVTDTKREAWLRDLANPEVPLRKQSRTIPHGIRGKLLMEQCLSKEIPLRRAVWLAKCVGANELRAFRRKGVSGSTAASNEAKWVREWTVHVEQFLESVIATCGQQNWQKNMNYAVKLATAFYAEKLLEAEHYLDWIVSSLSEASLESLPVWILVAQIYWKSITMYGKRGKRFAEGILEHLHQITQSNSNVNAVLKTRLQKLVAVLATSNRGCLIIPQVWGRYEYLLKPKADLEGPTNTPAKNISRRNERLAAPLCKTAANTSSPLLELYKMLDSIGIDFDQERMVDKCLAFVPDTAKLVFSLLDWASTPYRAGITRVYLAANVIARLQRSSYDTDAVILRYLSDSKMPLGPSTDNVHRVIVDLVRQEVFSVGRYLQWLITSGVLPSGEGSTCATGLIAALPTTGLSLNVLNTRQTLMRRLGYTTDEDALVDAVLVNTDNAITRSSTDCIAPITLPASLTMSAKFSIGQRMCTKLNIMAKEYGLSLGVFTVARDIFERTEDISVLGMLVTAAAVTSDAALLATACDTINLHAESFAALGQFEQLVNVLTEQYGALRSQQPPDRTFILALIDLVQRVPGKNGTVKLLNDDLVICEQQNSLAVCSPASDSLIGMHATSLDSDDDIDAVFASGNMMDEQLMRRVFVRIMKHTAQPPPPSPEPMSKIGRWLSQLRSVDNSGVFDRLVHSYLLSITKECVLDDYSSGVVTSLVASGSVLLSSVADMAKRVSSPQCAATMLGWFISPDVANYGLHESERYRYRLQQERCCSEQADSVITLIRTACDMPEFDVENPDLVRFLIRCVSARPDSVRRIFEDGQHSEALRTNAGCIVNTMLQCDRSLGDKTRDFNISSLVSMVNPFSILYCIDAIRYFKTVTGWSQIKEEAFGEAILALFNCRSEVWTQLLGCTEDSTKKRLHEWAQDQLLDMVKDKGGLEDENADDRMKRCLDLLAMTSKAANKTDSTAIVGTLTDKLKDYEKRLSNFDSFTSGAKEQFASLLNCLRLVLHLSVMHVHPLSDESEASIQARTHLLMTLCSLLVHPRLQTHQDIIEYLFDLSSTLSDTLSDVSQASRKLPDSKKLPLDARLAFIMGSSTSSADSWLALASQVFPAGSQQQRALNKYPSQQPQGSGRPLASPHTLQSPTQLQPQHQRWPSQSGHTSIMRQDSRIPTEVKMTPYPLRRWEIMPDPTPVIGENDASLSLGLFGARKA